MTKQEYRKAILKEVTDLKLGLCKVIYNGVYWALVGYYDDYSYYLAQGEGAIEQYEEVKNLSKLTGLSLSNCAIYYLSRAGALSK